MKRLLGQVALETRLFLRRKDDLFWTLAFPMFFMVIYGLVYGDVTWADYQMRAIDYLLPGIIVLAVMTTGIMATSAGFAEEREKGIYRRLSLTPLSRQSLLGGQIIHRYLVVLVQTLLLLAVGILAFDVKITGNYLWFGLVLTVGALCFLCIGFALTILIKTARSATPIGMTAFFVLMFFGGIFFPISLMPNFLQTLSKVLPSTYLGDALRLVAINGAGFGEIWPKLLALLGWMLGCFLLTVKFFRWE